MIHKASQRDILSQFSRMRLSITTYILTVYSFFQVIQILAIDLASKGIKAIDYPKEVSSGKKLSPDPGKVYFRLGFRMLRYALYSYLGGDGNRLLRHLKNWFKHRQERKSHL